MTSLLGYLVERSVRSRPPAAAGVPGFGDGPQAVAEGPTSLALRPGMIRPRNRSRHEPWPEVAPSDPGALVPTEEMREWPAARGAEAPQAEPPEAASATERADLRAHAPLSIRPGDAAPAIGMTVHRTVIEHRVAQQAGSDMAGPEDISLPPGDAPARPDRDRAAVDHTAHAPREARQQAPELSSEAAERVQPRPKPTERARDALPQEIDRPPGLARAVSRAPAQDVEKPAPAPDRPVRPEETHSSRELVAISPVVAPRQAVAPSAVPRIEVNIGRVEVRAVYAQPSQPAARKQPSSPPTSLDDYLKQRDGTG